MTWKTDMKKVQSDAKRHLLKRIVLTLAMIAVIGAGSMNAFAAEDGTADPVDKGVAVIQETGNASGETAVNDPAVNDTAESKDTTAEAAASPEAFSVTGNATVVDRITDGTKEFYTIRTANNQTYYLVIDLASNMENVYMLSAIDEDDLQDFVNTGESTKTAGIILDEETLKAETQAVDEKTDGSGMQEDSENDASDKDGWKAKQGRTFLITLLVFAVAAIALFVIVKFVRPNKKEPVPESEHMEEIESYETIDEGTDSSEEAEVDEDTVAKEDTVSDEEAKTDEDESDADESDTDES